VLDGFYDDITLNIRESEQIYAKIHAKIMIKKGTLNIQELVIYTERDKSVPK
jgi:hypothetical protein